MLPVACCLLPALGRGVPEDEVDRACRAGAAMGDCYPDRRLSGRGAATLIRTGRGRLGTTDGRDDPLRFAVSPCRRRRACPPGGGDAAVGGRRQTAAP